MKPNRSQLITMFMVVLALCIGILLNGCATTGDSKDAEPEMEPPQELENENTALQQTSGSTPEVQKQPVANTGASSVKPRVQTASLKAGRDMFAPNATYLKQALDRILPAKLSDLNWNRIATVLTGILVILMIYGLAFGLARLPARRRGAGFRGGARQ